MRILKEDLLYTFRLLRKSPGFTLVVALLASYVPARRATQVDPMIALRNE